jgi:hypothetical protein
MADMNSFFSADVCGLRIVLFELMTSTALSIMSLTLVSRDDCGVDEGSRPDVHFKNQLLLSNYVFVTKINEFIFRIDIHSK